MPVNESGAQKLRPARIKIGRRVYFRVNAVAQIIDSVKGGS